LSSVRVVFVNLFEKVERKLIDESVQRFEALKKRKQELQTKEIQMKTVLKSLKEEFEKELAELKEKTNVKSLKEAKELKDSMEGELTELLDKLSSALNAFGKDDGSEFIVSDL